MGEGGGGRLAKKRWSTRGWEMYFRSCPDVEKVGEVLAPYSWDGPIALRLAEQGSKSLLRFGIKGTSRGCADSG